MIKSNLQSIIAVEFTELGNFNPSQHDSKVWCSFYFCKKVTLGAVFLCSLWDEFSWKTSTFDPFLPLSWPSLPLPHKQWLTHWPPHSPRRSVEKTTMLSAKANDTTRGKQETSQTVISRPRKALGEIPGTFSKSNWKGLLSKNEPKWKHCTLAVGPQSVWVAEQGHEA